MKLKDGLLEPLDVISRLVIISVVGAGMWTQRGLATKLFRALAQANINIIAIAQGFSERSISVVVDNESTSTGIRVAHQMLFNTVQVIEVFVIGAGVLDSLLSTVTAAATRGYGACNNVIVADVFAGKRRETLLEDWVSVMDAEIFNLHGAVHFVEKLPAKPEKNIVYQCQHRFCEAVGKTVLVACGWKKYAHRLRFRSRRRFGSCGANGDECSFRPPVKR